MTAASDTDSRTLNYDGTHDDPAMTEKDGNEVTTTTAVVADTTTYDEEKGTPPRSVDLEKPDVATSSTAQDDEIEYPGPWRLLVIILGLYLAVFLVALDQTIIGTAIPKITDQFHSIGDIGW